MALLIGNSRYRGGGWSTLINPARDVAAMDQLLRERLGFVTVITATDQDLDQLQDALDRFDRALQPGATALLFYSGHGATVDGDDYLIPVDARVPRNGRRLRKQSLAVTELLAVLNQNRTALNIVILDACRNNPLGGGQKGYGDSGLKGVPQGDLGSETLIAYAAAPGRTANDGRGRLSPYTAALVQQMGRPGADLWQVFGAVGGNVRETTAGQQEPWFNSSLTRPHVLLAGGHDQDLADWQTAQQCATVACYRAYIDAHPNGRFVALARAAAGREQPSTVTRRPTGPSSTGAIAPLPSVAVVQKPPPPVAKPNPARVTTRPQQSFEPEMVRIPGGSFRMGSNDGASREKPVHRVTVKPFLIGKYEVTQAQWQAVMGDNPSNFNSFFFDCEQCPVESVLWDEVQDYIRNLNAKTGRTYRLPSEAEWEYAARAGTATPFSTGSCIHTDGANYKGSWVGDSGYNDCGAKTGVYRKNPLPVGSFSANPWGLHDVHGNVREWTQDCWNESYEDAPADGSAWQSGDCHSRVGRGGSYYDIPFWVRSAYRFRFYSGHRDAGVGFRLSRAL